MTTENNDLTFLSMLNDNVVGLSLDTALYILARSKEVLVPALSHGGSFGTGFDLYTTEGLTAYARTLPKVTDELAKGKFIGAIKEYRTHLNTLTSDYAVSGLKSVKDALDPIKHAYTPWDEQQY